ncbi:MAG: hypothetical protein ACRD3T_15270 [Terriglobia bacterium]
MRLSQRIFSIGLLATLFFLSGATLRADSIPINGEANFYGGEYAGLTIYSVGPGLSLYGDTPDAPNYLNSCTCALSATGQAWPSPYYSGGSLGDLTADYISAGIVWTATEPVDPPPGWFVSGELPVTFFGSAVGYNSLDQEIFAVDYSGTGTAGFYGYAFPGGGAWVYSSNMNITSGTATVEYEQTPEPAPIVLLASGLALIAVSRRSVFKHAPGP